MTSTNRLSVALAPLIAAALGGCASVSPGATGHPVSIAMTSTGPAAALAGPLALNSFRLVIGGVALGSGDQFGCVDCNGRSETSFAPEIVSVSLAGAPVQVRTEPVQPGTYSGAEIEVVAPTASVLAAAPGWSPGTTLEVMGTISGRPFTLQVAAEGSFRQRLVTPLVVGAGGAGGFAQVTITLPVVAWFTGPTGPLDPTSAADRATIEANIRASFTGPESRRPEAGR